MYCNDKLNKIKSKIELQLQKPLYFHAIEV